MVARRINKSLVSNNPITLADFLPQNLNDFYRYNGSLTTPNCNEGVIWTIFKKPQNIPVSQVGSKNRGTKADGGFSV